ncbi:DNA mismatch repair endonuclease MutL [Aurantimonas sp. Leaf443]|uniref:DNA mismatch repair endonuclease MutL n=1 Tax=Aurantimonas sp. Leaf443 TaxID=1736378 RepID=UPI0006FDC5C2|nr:DNA mismatch repair endonuclease MutL [Aurantimonas sp. Leaf443]KQT87984.1 DNA mismatch repair protein MutL [Aurantimonas sp. Leaf443]
MTIRQLPDHLVDQIAAGEVVERPASVVKELVENAVDAGSTRIEIATAGGGRSLVRVTDDGCGIAADDLPLAVRRHCTSKLGHGLDRIETLGFRGEALPSIGSVARLTVRSRAVGSAAAAEVALANGACEGPRPAALSRGTVVEMRDLFHAVPARLKFLKSERAESAAITEIVRRIAVAFPQIRFELSGADRSTLVFEMTDAPLERLAAVIGAEFAENALEVEASREGVRLFGYAGLPAYSRGTSASQYLYVNGRPVRDKMLLSALRGAYADAMAKDRHPVVALFLEIDPELVDVNVHPAKADVRFRDPGLVRGLIVGALRQRFAQDGLRSSTANAGGLMARFAGGAPRAEGRADAPVTAAPRRPDMARFEGFAPGSFSPGTPYSADASPFRPLDGVRAPPAREAFGFDEAPTPYQPEPDSPEPAERHPLGAARAQIHGNFIVAETQDGIVIVDQHAAHERLVYEALKGALYGGGALASQFLLIPEIVAVSEEDADRLAEAAETLARLGLSIERFGPGAVAVRETPSILGAVDCGRLVRDIADELAEAGTPDALRARIDHVAATVACHGSVRSGRILKADEMNALLRSMEAVPGSGTCNHGRPTFIALKLADIERMFGRR